jgi:hypothetical protein
MVKTNGEVNINTKLRTVTVFMSNHKDESKLSYNCMLCI